MAAYYVISNDPCSKRVSPIVNKNCKSWINTGIWYRLLLVRLSHEATRQRKLSPPSNWILIDCAHTLEKGTSSTCLLLHDAIMGEVQTKRRTEQSGVTEGGPFWTELQASWPWCRLVPPLNLATEKDLFWITPNWFVAEMWRSWRPSS